MNIHISGKIAWKNPKTMIYENAIVLFCIDNKCMSGKVLNLVRVNNSINEYYANISFIEPNYFAGLLKKGIGMTIQDASRVIGLLEVIDIFEPVLISR